MRLFFILMTAYMMHGLPMFAQNYERALEISERYYEEGLYKKALENCDALIAKLQKQRKGLIVYKASLYKAKYLEALGEYGEFESLVNLTLKRKQYKGEGHLVYGKALLEAASLYLIYSDINTAESLLSEAQLIINGSSSSGIDKDGNAQDSYFLSEEMWISANIHLGRGEYDQARALFPKLLDLRAQRMLNRELFYNELSDRYEDRKLDPFQVRRRKREYADAMILQAQNERLSGHYAEAESYLQAAEGWIKNNLNRKDLAWIKSQHERSLLMADRGDDPRNIQQIMEKNLFLAERRLGLVHKTFLAIHGSLINFYIQQRKRKSNVQQWELRVNTSKYFGKQTTPHAISQRLDARKKYYNRNVEGALEELKGLYGTKGKIPLNHTERIALLEQLYEVALSKESYEEALGYLQELQQTQERIYGKASLPYYYSQMKLANFLSNYTNRFEEADSLLQSVFYGKIAPYITKQHTDYTQFLGQMADFYRISGQYDSAWHLTNQVVEIQENKFGKGHLRYAIALERLIDMDLRMGHFQQADSNINTMLGIYRSGFNRKVYGYEYSEALETAARYYATMGLFDEAKTLLSGASRYFSRSINARANSSAVDELAYLYIQTERYKQTENMLTEAIAVRLQRYGDSSRFLITPYNQLARLRLIQGEYVQAERMVNKAHSISAEVFGDAAYQITESLIIKAEISRAMGDYDKAEDYFGQAIEVLKAIFGTQHIELANAYAQLALTQFFRGGNLASAEKLMEQSKGIIEANLGNTNPVYAQSLQNLALLYAENGKLEQSQQLLSQAANIWNSRLGTHRNTNTAEITLLQGDVDMKRGNSESSLAHYREAQKTFAKVFNKNHPSYVKATARMSQAYLSDGNWNKAKARSEEVLGNYLHYIDEIFPVLSDREKAQFWNKIRGDFEFYTNLAISKAEKNKALTGKIYDQTLATKALLLSASIKVRNSIQSSNDQALKEDYANWVEKKETLTKVLSMTNEQLKEGGYDPKKLEKEIEDLEKKLSEQSSLFAQNQAEEAITWKDIKKALRPGEAAVEIIRFRHFDQVFTDSVIYAALIVKPQSRFPELVMLPNGNRLEEKYLRYYRACIIYNLNDQNSYQHYWAPIEAELAGIDKIYLSAEGVYNQINIEAMRYEDGSFVIDRKDLVLVSNTRDILTEEALQQPGRDAYLIGNPVFYKDLTEEQYTQYNTRKVSQLPGTQKEVIEITKMLEQTLAVHPKTYINLDATEEQVKGIADPRIFHIATHGFFLPDEEVGKGAENSLTAQRLVNNPLLRSGLLLRNAGELIEGGNVYGFNRENGVLTAYEAMNLSLDNTELVILSACETGRGEVKVGEGVYGLQRAFLVAGARAVIMSLFKVSDEATQKLMEAFYENWIGKRMDKREAFSEAKRKVRNEYKDPIFWAAFVMVNR